eukprot:CAMPEP_0170206876 /NCGR_PEP_ID=MMETSP0116_2-20130129/3006_1 /TAXON_ID=400756 /ORGANISM="Durinskia baltica, Strain CSIRO CS-38" /LENGTH=97 /DNA_ID=CAMNT_0010457315 /DNA_START=262 /DNA_END=554 /DNA_ORIENTATION=+
MCARLLKHCLVEQAEWFVNDVVGDLLILGSAVGPASHSLTERANGASSTDHSRSGEVSSTVSALHCAPQRKNISVAAADGGGGRYTWEWDVTATRHA